MAKRTLSPKEKEAFTTVVHAWQYLWRLFNAELDIPDTPTSDDIAVGQIEAIELLQAIAEDIRKGTGLRRGTSRRYPKIYDDDSDCCFLSSKDIEEIAGEF